MLDRPCGQTFLHPRLGGAHGIVVSVGMIPEGEIWEESRPFEKALTAQVELSLKEGGEGVHHGAQMRCCLCFAG